MAGEFPNPISVQLLGKGERKQLAQVRPSDTANTILYSPAVGVIAEIHCLFVSNSTAGAAVYRLFHDDDGSTFDASTALIFGKNVGVNDFELVTFDTPIYMINDAGTLGVQSQTGDALNFTIYGEEFSRSK